MYIIVVVVAVVLLFIYIQNLVKNLRKNEWNKNKVTSENSLTTIKKILFFWIG